MSDEFAKSDIGRARLFADRMKDRFCYVPEYKGWAWWDGRAWRRDEGSARVIGAMIGLIENEMERAAEDNDQPLVDYWGKCQSATKIDAAVKLARSFLVIHAMEFDLDPDLLNVENGILFLRTGDLVPHTAIYKMTRVAGAPYEPEATCPTWDGFLRHAVPDEATRRFLQRAVGYSLTGHPIEQAFFVLSGTEGTGKGTFFDAIATILGEYAGSCRPDTLSTKPGSGTRSDLARLRGSRFVSANETKHTDELDLALIKIITGEDPLTVAMKYENEITFTPAWKTWLSYNHAPTIPVDSTGYWRRLKVVEFNQQPKKGDPHLRAKLRKEAPGILAWAVRGAQAWYEQGLNPPEAVMANVRKVQDRHDSVGAFYRDRIIVDPTATLPVREFYAAYKTHCEEVLQVKPGTIQLFSEKMQHIGGVEHKRTAKGSYLRGIRLNTLGPSLHPFEADGEMPEDMLEAVANHNGEGME